MNKIELYIHIPFCEKKCNYCDFVSFKPSIDTISQYIDTLISEIASKKYLASECEVSSIYIGGGTPSYIDSKYIVNILETIYNNYNVSNDAEISIEINPNSANEQKLNDYFKSGINRLSIGLQSTDDNELKTLGRIHTYNDFLIAFNNAIHIGFKNINVDLINGIPGQSIQSYKKSLKQVLMLNIKHISIYNLIIEEGTKFYDQYVDGKLPLPLEEDIVNMDNITKELTSYYRLNRYEISNYAKTGFECKHNLGYWSDVPYIGFGLNSSSYISNKRYKNKCKIDDYLKLDFKSFISPEDETKYYDEILTLDTNDLMSEFVMLSLRKSSGVNTLDFFNKFNAKFEDVFKTPLKIYQSMELINKHKSNYFLTDNGLDVSNTILCDFLLK